MDYEDDMIRVLLPGHTKDNPKFTDIDLPYEDDIDEYLDRNYPGWQGYAAVPKYSHDRRSEFRSE